MHWVSCGTENPSTVKFCEGCDTPIARRCDACGATPSPTARFCGECGGALTPAGADGPTEPASSTTSRVAPAVPVSERRWVSVLFCDLVGFTTLSESKDAEEVRELLSSHFDVARTVVTRYGGTLEKFIGDAVMAVWGHRWRKKTMPSER